MELIEILIIALCDSAVIDSMNDSDKPFYKRFGCWFMIIILLGLIIGGAFYLMK